MKRLAALWLSLSVALVAADPTGRWSGNIEFTTRDGELRQDTALVELKLEGQAITGTVGRDADRRFPIRSGKLDGSKVTFEVLPDQGPVMRFVLTVDGERLHGTAKGEEGDHRIEVKLDLKKTP